MTVAILFRRGCFYQRRNEVKGNIPEITRPPAIGEPERPIGDTPTPPIEQVPRDYIEPLYAPIGTQVPKSQSATKKGA